jgi:O-antigen ligase
MRSDSATLSQHTSDQRARSSAPGSVILAAGPGVGNRTERSGTRALTPALRLAFYAFVCSLPFETMDIGIEVSYIKLSKIVGYFFIAVALLHPRVCFRRFPAALGYFLLYLLAFAIFGAVQEPEYQGMILSRLFTYVQMLTLFWVSYNLLRHETIIQGTLMALAASCSLLAILQVFGVTSHLVSVTGEYGRVTALREHPNGLAAVLALGFLALMGLAYRRRNGAAPVRLLAWPLLTLLAIAIVKTGSRGGLLALAAGLLTFALTGESTRSRARNVLVVLLAALCCIWLVERSPTARWRWQMTLDDPLSSGSLARREEIFPTAWAMFLERPLTGWGPSQHSFELGRRLGVQKRSTHNLVLWLLVEVGLVGTIPFLVGTWRCVRAAWRARDGTQGVLPLAMTLTVLVINMSGSWQYYKLHWLVMAYAMASGCHLIRRRWRKEPVRSHLLPGRRLAATRS